VALGGTAPTLEEAAVLEAEAKARKAAKQQARLANEAARAVR
jgi:hypothetical protein